MTRLAASKVRQQFSDVLNRVSFGQERIIIVRNGHDVAALVSVEDLALLEHLEDRRDVEAAKKALKGGDFMSYDAFKKKFKLS